jgi:hypothetical protein
LGLTRTSKAFNHKPFNRFIAPDLPAKANGGPGRHERDDHQPRDDSPTRPISHGASLSHRRALAEKNAYVDEHVAQTRRITSSAKFANSHALFSLEMPMQDVATEEAPKKTAIVASATVLPVLFAISFSHLLNDTIQALIPSIYPILKESFQLSFGQLGGSLLCFNAPPRSSSRWSAG